MARRYPVERPFDGETLRVEAWNNNHNELAQEFNGYLDRDNFENNGLDDENVIAGSFNEFGSTAVGTDISLTTDTVAWETTDGTTSMPSITKEVDGEALIVAEFSPYWEWQTFDGLVEPDEDTEYGRQTRCVRFRVLVDGSEVALSGWISSDRERDAMYLVGVAPVSAGRRVVTTEVQRAYVNTLNPSYLESPGSTGNIKVLINTSLVVQYRKR